jgi:glycosyltransferase involved in cell wall biosynthesis
MTAFSFRSLSVVVPVFDEEENVRPLVERVVAAARELELPFELIVVDDGSRDDTLPRLRRLAEETPELVILALRRNFGQTLALQAGLDRARGDVIVTMDGDLQNDPADIPRLLHALEQGADVVSGWRRQRQDTLILRKVPSWVANRMIRALTRVPVHDQGCSLKAYRRDIIEAIHLYGDLHRFIAVLTLPVGAQLAEVEVQHHPRVAGESKYGLSRVLKVLADLATLRMITGFREHPLRWFAMLSVPFLVGAPVMWTLALGFAEAPVVPVSLGLVLAMTGLSCLVPGLIGELIVESDANPRLHTIVFRQGWPAAEGVPEP